MINVEEYCELRKAFMTKYEKTAREWLFGKGGLCAELAYEIPFLWMGRYLRKFGVATQSFAHYLL